MDIRTLLKDLVPPILVRAIRNRQHGLVSGPIWKGIYSRYRDVPARSEGYHGVDLADRTYALTARLLAAARGRGRTPLPPFPGGVHALLPLTVTLVARAQGRVRVLDFGGGMGVGFIHLLGSLRPGMEMEYDVVETRVMCDGGRRLFAGDPRIRFHTELPPLAGRGAVDIVYISSALQYVEDYATLLTRLCEYGATYVLFTNLAAGDVPTYATAQCNLRGMRLPHWFLNVTELVDLLEARSHSLVFASLTDREYDQRNLPVEYRVRHACNLLFARVEAATPPSR
jgi:putative methyltransferase (TIGR04325 family)